MFDDRDIMGMYSKEIGLAYKKYVREISPRWMAASIECCVFLMLMCKDINPKKVLDLGSGFSSYALRHYKEKYNKDMVVWSVDSSIKWLLKSKKFIVDFGLNADHFYTWEDVEYAPERFDLVFMDIDSTRHRPPYLKHVIENFITPESFILLDDMHENAFVNKVKIIMKDYVYRNVDVEKYTLDRGNKKMRRGLKTRFCGLYYGIEKPVIGE